MNLKTSIFTLLGVAVFSSFTPINTDPEKIIVVLDAGHGGNDAGATTLNIIEKDLTLEIVQRVKAQNKNANVKIILTRDSDQMINLQDRSNLINKVNPTFFISVHVNKTINTELNGNEIFHYPTNQEAKVIAEKFYQSIDNPLVKRGVKEANFHILRNTKSPGFIYEIGFASNSDDYKYITSEEGKNKIVTEIVNFINQP